MVWQKEAQVVERRDGIERAENRWQLLGNGGILRQRKPLEQLFDFNEVRATERPRLRESLQQTDVFAKVDINADRQGTGGELELLRDQRTLLMVCLGHDEQAAKKNQDA